MGTLCICLGGALSYAHYVISSQGGGTLGGGVGDGGNEGEWGSVVVGGGGGREMGWRSKGGLGRLTIA